MEVIVDAVPMVMQVPGERAMPSSRLRTIDSPETRNSSTSVRACTAAARDSRVQFYVAYSYYRQGWGRMYNDDALFRKGLETVEHAIAIAIGVLVDAGIVDRLASPVEIAADEKRRGLVSVGSCGMKSSPV